ncbi:sigma-70 family RNA polymerase sigma factor [Paraburkholderia bengalensis]
MPRCPALFGSAGVVDARQVLAEAPGLGDPVCSLFPQLTMNANATMKLRTFDEEDQAAELARRTNAAAKAERRLAALLDASISGDKHAYHRFLDELARHLRARLRKQLRQQDADVEDLVQEVLIAVHKGLDTFRPDVPLTAWISAIVRYKLADHFRANLRRGEMFEPLDDDVAVEGISPLDSLEARRDLTRLLDTLPERQRHPIEHTKLLGLSIAETAATTGLTESAVKIGIFAASAFSPR